MVKDLKHNDKGTEGLFSNYDGIEIKSQSPSFVQAEALIHELLHGIFYSTNMIKITGTEQLEEIFVTQFGTGLASLIKDNPDLIKQLQKALK